MKVGDTYVSKAFGHLLEIQELLPSYVAWTCMLERCYKRGSLEDVAEVWYFYENFKEWYDNNVPSGWFVDKDYKVIGNTYYSPDTCTPLPCELNSLLTKSLSAKGYSYTRNGNFDVRVRVEGTKIVRKLFYNEESAYRFYVEEKIKYIKRLKEKYSCKVPDYVFFNAEKLLIAKLHDRFPNTDHSNV